MSSTGPKDNPIEIAHEIFRLLRVGFRNERCEINKGVITYHDPNVQAVNSAVKKFETTPNPEHFESVQHAVSNCKQQGKTCFDYPVIESLFATIAKLQSPPESKSKNKI